MFFLLNILHNYFFRTLLSIFLVYIFYRLFDLYKKVLELPPGPIPLPFIGNILYFCFDGHWYDNISKIIKEFGPVITIWVGSEPFVFISDIEIARESFNKADFSGRMTGYLHSILEGGNDVAMSDYGPIYTSLRRVSYAAAVKFSTNEKLPNLVCDCVDQTVNEIIKKEGFNKQFDSSEYIYNLFTNIMASIAFGRVFSDRDEISKVTKSLLKDPFEEVGGRYVLWELSPLVRLFDWKAVRRNRKNFKIYRKLLTELYKSHYNNFDNSIERDFCDALISSINDPLRVSKITESHLNDENLANCVMDLFFAGIESTNIVFNWILLILSYFPEIQKRLRKEIMTQIGERIPTQEDKEKCNYVMAFISEILRCKNSAFTSFPHKAIKDTKLGDYFIAKDTALILLQKYILMDEKNWEDAHEFRPDRFLDNDKYIKSQNKAYIPFSVGRRYCLGEKLAINDLFLVLVRILQLTKDHKIVLGENNGLDADPKNLIFNSPKKFKIIFEINNSL